jgi:hypothetical protein
MKMKRFLIAVFLVFFFTGFAAAQVGPGRTMYVNVKTVDLKSATGFFASTRGTLNYGDQVTVVQVDGKYAEVKSDDNSSLTGWTALTNLTTRQVVAGARTSASVSEVALSGKGFNRENENTYRAQGEINYDRVEKIETLSVNEEELMRFIEEGGLKLAE